MPRGEKTAPSFLETSQKSKVTSTDGCLKNEVTSHWATLDRAQ